MVGGSLLFLGCAALMPLAPIFSLAPDMGVLPNIHAYVIVILGGMGSVSGSIIAGLLIGLLALPGYTPNYNDRAYLPDFIPSNQGFAAADRHFSQARMKPEILMIESDHDMRNPTDFLVLDMFANYCTGREDIKGAIAVAERQAKRIYR